MAGRRQHFIPQFLLKGFKSHSIGKETYTWVYRKGTAEAFNTNIKNIGIEGDFYSIDKNFCLDEIITSAEIEFGEFVQSLRLRDEFNRKDTLKAAQLIAHFEIRTRNLRELFINAGNFLINEMLDFLHDPIKCEIFVRKQIEIDLKTSITQTLKESLIDKGIPGSMVPLYLPSLLKALPEHIEKAMPEMVDQMAKMTIYLRNTLPLTLKDSAKLGHINALSKNICPPIKVKKYANLKFSLINTSDLPLGDSAVFFQVKHDRMYKTFIESDDEVTAVLLPISSEKILVGSSGNGVVNTETLHMTIAACSIEYFISSKNNNEMAKSSFDISKNAYFLSQADIEKLIRSLT